MNSDILDNGNSKYCVNMMTDLAIKSVNSRFFLITSVRISYGIKYFREEKGEATVFSCEFRILSNS